MAGEFVVFKRDTNSRAGLWAVFLGDKPLHHFKEGAPVGKYVTDVRLNLEKYVASQLAEIAADMDELCEWLVDDTRELCKDRLLDVSDVDRVIAKAEKLAEKIDRDRSRSVTSNHEAKPEKG